MKIWEELKHKWKLKMVKTFSRSGTIYERRNKFNVSDQTVPSSDKDSFALKSNSISLSIDIAWAGEYIFVLSVLNKTVII